MTPNTYHPALLFPIYYSLLMLFTGFSLAIRQALTTTHTTIRAIITNAVPTKYNAFMSIVSAN